MAKREVYICDECGAERKEANHWFVVGCDQLPEGRSNLRISQFTDPHNEQWPYDLCGQSCVIAAVNRFMSEGKLEK